MTALKIRLRRFLLKAEGHEEIQTPEGISQEFTLFYRHHHIGTLALKNGRWSFFYSEYFKTKLPIQPLSDFPEVKNIYAFEELHPFFLQRIPSLKQRKIKEIIEKEKLDIHNEVELLKRFGKLTISNPFILQAV